MKLSSFSGARKLNNNTEVNVEFDEAEECEFDKLDEDSVLCIFKYLDPKELTICERVSKSWRYLALISWRSIQSLTFHEYFGCFGQPILSNPYLQNILMKTGECLKVIDMSHITFQKLYPGFGKIIAKFCPRLCSLNLNQIPVTDEELKEIAQRCLLLEALSLDRCIKITDVGLEHVLTKCQFLKSLTLSQDTNIKGSCFLQHSLHLLELNIGGTDFEPSNYMNLCDSCGNLENLNLSGTQLSSNAILNICSSLTNLTTLSLNGCSLLDCDNWRNWGKMQCLRFLYLNKAVVGDNIFHAVGFSCPLLHHLEISGLRYNNINDSLRHLISLQQLQYLDISHSLYLKGSGLGFISELSALKSLILKNCGELEDSGIFLMLAGNHSLQYLDIRGCRRISDKSCTLLEMYVTKKTDKLLVLAGSTGISKSYADKKYDYLQFNMNPLTEEFIMRDDGDYYPDDHSIGESEQDDREEYLNGESDHDDLAIDYVGDSDPVEYDQGNLQDHCLVEVDHNMECCSVDENNDINCLAENNDDIHLEERKDYYES